MPAILSTKLINFPKFMKKFALVASSLGLCMLALSAQASVTLNIAPTSLVPDPLLIPASSGQVGLFSFQLTVDAGETFTNTKVQLTQVSGSVASGDLSSVALWRDDGNGSFSSGSDTQLVSNSTVNVGSDTLLTLPTTTPATGKFFVSVATSGSVSTGDQFTVILPADAIILSANSPSTTAVTTNTITADVTAPTLSSAVAQNTGGTSAKEAGDSVKLMFSESTNKPAITTGNIGSVFSLSSGHSFLDTTGNLGGTSWNVAGTELLITLSNTGGTTSTLPTVQPGDTVTATGGSTLRDLAGNPVSGFAIISGNFTATSTPPGDDDDDDEGRETHCANSLINGRLYKVGTEQTVYLAAACRLKPFRGQAVFHARGHKFQNIITLSSLPTNVTVSQHPVLPAEGTLIKGSDKTVWFIGSDHKRHGFVSAVIFLNLGFNFSSVQTISDQDLNLTPVGQTVNSDQQHPDGTLLLCQNSPAVYEIENGKKFGFRTANAFLSRGHSWEHVVRLNCAAYNYTVGAPVD
ncbi:MAG: hypothetical protein A2722_02060 [Candidatus Doudnabacteria bacterium RIFCSPHIGHO2_01_FULL_50_11]|uniref:Bacterial Ig-like domain-containing protein n=1 Tax=Candidatus Doudnabacteria bacterium RIFCSPHIGHO2_01_FULL_50_11 TaxID=1817828 RepID=A0A1F5PHL0_9BACT|nr:MAG: hypothetical protein A2722_02060 [Candidatus Doudnabacteria bacterium RIFCSPHIGHO2_01_FULL_50_11]